MNDYREVRLNISPCNEDTTDLMAAMLADFGYESFVPDDSGLTAYVKAEDYNQSSVEEVINDFPIPCKIEFSSLFVPGQDWNAEWEKNYFKPIVVGDCVIHSTFHTDIPVAKYDIAIDPKMAFGTGHHATTSLILAKLLEMDLDGKSVIDMGTGTGILAILAAMRGANPVYGVEIDGFAYANAVDNTVQNNHPEIKLYHGDADVLQDIQPVDIFIANINRNIITADIASYAKVLKSGGTMLLSGFYESDIPVVLEAAGALGLKEVNHSVKGDNWTCLELVKV